MMLIPPIVLTEEEGKNATIIVKSIINDLGEKLLQLDSPEKLALITINNIFQRDPLLKEYFMASLKIFTRSSAIGDEFLTKIILRLLVIEMEVDIRYKKMQEEGE